MLPMYNRQIFSDIFPDVESFKKCLSDEFDGYAKSALTDDNKTVLYWLLFARYGNNPITNNTVNQFKAKMVSIVFSKGPSWEKNLDIQSKIRSLSDEELRKGAVNIYNQALHPETSPGTGTTEELDYINQQNVNKHKRSAMDAYSFLMDLIKTDVTEVFIKAFSGLFSRFVGPMRVDIYENDLPEEEGGGDDQ